jgi:hypothetical protein
MHRQCNNPEQRVDDAEPDQQPRRRMTRRGRAQDQQLDFVLDDSTAVSPRATPPRWVVRQRQPLWTDRLYLIRPGGPSIACPDRRTR